MLLFYEPFLDKLHPNGFCNPSSVVFYILYGPVAFYILYGPVAFYILYGMIQALQKTIKPAAYLAISMKKSSFTSSSTSIFRLAPEVAKMRILRAAMLL